MKSEHYEMGFKDGSEGAPPRQFSCAVWQYHYNEGYADGRKGVQGFVAEQMRTVLYRGGC